jgi:hypothetical protein
VTTYCVPDQTIDLGRIEPDIGVDDHVTPLDDLINADEPPTAINKPLVLLYTTSLKLSKTVEF